MLEGLSRADWFCMAFWPWIVAVACVRRWTPRWGPGHTAVLALVFAWTAAAFVPFAFAPPVHRSSLGVKAAIESGELEIESALFPPLPFGFAETNSSEVLRPPTWLASSEIDADGRYLRGSRRTSADPVTGRLPPGNPVHVSSREPAPNCWHRHLLGTDSLGRDLLARLLWGGRASLVIGLLAAALVVAVGVALGALAGWFGRWVDAVLSRGIEVFASFPAVFVIVVVAALTPARALDPVLAIPLVVGAIGWTSVARLMRGEVLRVKQLDFIAAARGLGLCDARILVRHVLPNAIQPVIVAAAFLVGWGIFVEAGVSFLGFGVEPPTPSWGALLGDSREHWWIQVFPGASIAVTVLACHLLGEALRDALDPRGAFER